MYLKLYAETPVRRTSQLLADGWFVFWTWLWVALALELYRLVSKLAVAGQKLEATGRTLNGDMTSAQDRVNGVPVIGHQVSAPFGKVGAAGRSLISIGMAQEHAVHDVAVFLAVCVAAIPIALLAMLWLPRRIRFVRRATVSRRLVASAGDLDLFALRALSTQPMHLLARVSADPADSWRRKDPAVIYALASLELADAGLRAPAPAAGPLGPGVETPPPM
ncbi:MAG: hypothetical protein DLM57_12550 [Pseudonocardiales bacterium]|nr:MAG: hypothetical protein DLM57_12550 [Pseudonocardiales bacterium]